MERMDGKVCLVTGASSGIGLEMARGLAARGATVVGVGRHPGRCARAESRIREQTGNPQVIYLRTDLSDQSRVRQLAVDFRNRYGRLDVLINNAGAAFWQRKLSADGIEMTWALNHLAYFLLTNLLLELLTSSAPARVISVSSDAHFQGKLNLDDPELSNGYQVMKAYSQSKLANLLFTYELARGLEGSGVTANAYHPGLVRTRMGRDNGWVGRLVQPLIALAGISPQAGARTGLYLACSPEVAGISGAYFFRNRQKRSSAASYDERAARQLWDLSLQMVGLPPADGQSG